MGRNFVKLKHKKYLFYLHMFQEVKLQQESGAQYSVSLCFRFSNSFRGNICNGKAEANIVEPLYGGH